MISFKPFRDLMKKHEITTYYLRNKCEAYNLDHKTIARLLNDGSVSTHTINALCHIFQCQLSDIMEFTRDEESISGNGVWEEYDKFREDYNLSLKHNKTFPR